MRARERMRMRLFKNQWAKVRESVCMRERESRDVREWHGNRERESFCASENERDREWEKSERVRQTYRTKIEL